METQEITLESVREDLVKLNSTKFNDFGGEYNDNNVLDFATGRRSLYIGRTSGRSDKQKQQISLIFNYCRAKGFPVGDFMAECNQEGNFFLKDGCIGSLANCITLDQAIVIIEKDLAKI